MNREDIIRKMQDAGLKAPARGDFIFIHWDQIAMLLEHERAAEREACAKLVEPDEEHRRDANWGYLGGKEGVELLDNVATAIRARSNT